MEKKSCNVTFFESLSLLRVSICLSLSVANTSEFTSQSCDPGTRKPKILLEENHFPWADERHGEYQCSWLVSMYVPLTLRKIIQPLFVALEQTYLTVNKNCPVGGSAGLLINMPNSKCKFGNERVFLMQIVQQSTRWDDFESSKP